MSETEPRTEKRQTVWRKMAIVVPLAVGVGILAYAIKSRQPPPQNPQQESFRHVRVIHAAKVPVRPTVTGYGSVKPGAVWNAIPQVGGKVVYVHPNLKKGALIGKDTLIVRIDKADFEMAIAEARANIASAEARLQELKTTETNLKAVLEVERKSLELKRSQLERKQALQKRGTATPLSVEQEQRDTLAQERRVIDIENSLKLLPAQKSVQEAQIAVNRSRLETAKLNLSRTEIRVPFAGRVAEANVETTQFAQAGSRLAVIDSVDVAEIEAQFPVAPLTQFIQALDRNSETQRPRLSEDFAEVAKRRGFFTTIRLLSGPATARWRGDIVRISDTFDPQTRTVGIISAVRNSYAKARPGERPPLTKGMFVQVELNAPDLDPSIVLPVSAIHDGKVYVAGKENRLIIRSVETGLVIGNNVLVRKGLAAGERIVVSDIPYVLPDMLLMATRDTALEKEIAKSVRGPVTSTDTSGEQRR